MFTGVGLIAFCCIFGAAVAGFLLQERLPESQRTEATQKTVQTTMSVVAILAALVLGLLIASAKTGFDTIFAPFNATVIATILVGALSVSIAVNLIFDMDRPFAGFIKVSSAPMQQALEKMKP
jgi:archaellum biogenesis protein FlaJ (TadC family)